ncbi:conjugal transfer protein TraH [Candidatus Enterovibrio altilux]|uniref:conjugal transfer protein TraH n=1 Tax=Candidatus Enterovibrio altilux TaxID=1927128 RepID=UPI001CC24D9D|nr:conjugal transfer protein TraH [Candidatus Enterovibrio luxaltus]
MNYATVTNPGVYEGQSARYATLWEMSTRAPITQPFNFINAQTLKFSAGCGGIDFFAGGLVCHRCKAVCRKLTCNRVKRPIIGIYACDPNCITSAFRSYGRY